MLSPRKRMSSNPSRPNSSINDENMAPFHPSSEASISLAPSEPPSSPLVSNSFLYNLPDPTLNLPSTSSAGRLRFSPSPFKRSAIASLNKPLTHQQTQQLHSHKATTAARASFHPSSSTPRSPSKARLPDSTSRLQANLNAPGGLPTPPSSSEALTSTPNPSKQALAPLPQEPVSPSPSRTRTAVLSPANVSPSKAPRAATTPRSTQRTSANRLLSTANDDDTDDDDDDILRSLGSQHPERLQPLREADEDSDDGQEESEEEGAQQEEEEIQLISFKRGGPDATFLREIKENGWDQPMPPSPIKFTYLEPVAPRPPRQSSVGSRARSHSRSKTPQIRASPALSHASSRARSVRAASAAAVEHSQDISDDSIKSSGSTLTNMSRDTQARSKRASTSRKSVARSSAPPPVAVADLTRDRPSLPDSPGDDPLLLIGPDTYIIYHDQTPSAKQRPNSRISRASISLSRGNRDETKSSLRGHSTPLPAATVALPLHRKDRAGSASSSASRASLYSRMSGQPAGDTSTVADKEQDVTQGIEHAGLGDASYNDAYLPEDDAGSYLPYDNAGFASDSDNDGPEALAARTFSPAPPREAGLEKHEQTALEDISSMSDVSRSFADNSVVRGLDEAGGRLEESVADDSEILENGAHDQSESLDTVDKGRDMSANDDVADVSGTRESMDTSHHNESTGLGPPAPDESADASGHNEREELSATDESVNASAHESMDTSTRIESESASDAEEAAADVSLALDVSEAIGVSPNQPETSFEASMAGATVDLEPAEPATGVSVVAWTEADDLQQSADVGSQAVAQASFEGSQLGDCSQQLKSSKLADESLRSVEQEQSETTMDLSTAPAQEQACMNQNQNQSEVSKSVSEASNLEHGNGCDTVETDISFDVASIEVQEMSGPLTATLPIDGTLLPRPVVLIDNSRFEPKLAAVSFDSSVSVQHGAGAIDGQTTDVSIHNSILSFSDLSSCAPAPASEHNVSVSIRDVQEDSLADKASEIADEASISSVLSSPALAHSENEEVLLSKYQSSRHIVSDHRASFIRRLSLSTDSEHDSDIEQQPSDSEEDDAQHPSDSDNDDEQQPSDSEDDEEHDAVEGAENTSARRTASQTKRARSFVDYEAEEQDDSEGEEDGHEDDDPLMDENGASSDENENEEEGDESEDEEMSEDEGDEDSDTSSDRSQLDEDEQSASLMDPVVIVSSSASPAHTSSSSIRTPSADATSSRRTTTTHAELDSEGEDEQEEEVEEEDEYVVEVVRDSRDRSLRPSVHSAITDDEPQIHTLHLRQPAAHADETGYSTVADASHSRSRVLKLGQATSTPIVEISSLDPRAAARATAILKLFHKYVDEGWISGDGNGLEMGDATTGERVRRVVDAIRRADRQGRRLEDASELQQQQQHSTTIEGEDLTTLLMDAELSLAREGTMDSESFLSSRATSVASAVHAQGLSMASPATPFLPGGFRASPAHARPAAVSPVVVGDRTASPSTSAAASRITSSRTAGETSHGSTTLANLTKRKQPHHYHMTASSESFTFPGLSTPSRGNAPLAAKQARLSAALAPPSLSTLNPRVWDTKDWIRLDKYLASGVKKISSQLLRGSSSANRLEKARSYVDALFGVDVGQVAQMFLDDMHIPVDKRQGEWAVGKLEHRLQALQRKYLRKVQAKHPEALAQRPEQEREGDGEGSLMRSREGGDDSMATEDLDWSLNANTTAATHEQEQQPASKGRVSFGTPYRMGAHSTPAAGLLKKATSRAARDAVALAARHSDAGEGGEEGGRLYPALPATPRTPSSMTGIARAEEEHGGVMTKASRLISRLSGSFGGLLSSPRPTAASEHHRAKGKRKATEAELEAPPEPKRRTEVDGSANASTSSVSSASDSSVDSLLNNTNAYASRPGEITTTINASLLTNATSMLDPTWNGPPGRAKPTTGSSVRSRSHLAIPQSRSVASESRGGTGSTSSLQLVGGSSGVSHTPLSLLSPGTHRMAARKVDELRQSRAQRNWVSPRRQRASNPAPAPAPPRGSRAGVPVATKRGGGTAEASRHPTTR